MKTYKASLDTAAKIITLLFTFLLIAVITGTFASLHKPVMIMPLILAFIVTATYVFSFLFHPSSYSVNRTELIISRPAKGVKIRVGDIKNVERLTRKDLAWSVRIFGVGGLFGYYGKFSNKTIGPMTWYATRRNSYVLIQLKNNKKIIITPDEPEEFIKELSAVLR